MRKISAYALRLLSKAGIVLFALGAQLARADTGTYFTPAPDDKSLMLLNSLFATLFPEWGSATPNVGFEAAILALNAGALTVAGIFVAYTLAFGTVQSAHDGEALGKKWSKMWLPIRSAVGTALLVPVQSYCVAQMLVAWMMVQGVGLADNIWSTYLDTPISGAAFKPTIAPGSVESLGRVVFYNEICASKVNALLNADDVGTNVKIDPVAFQQMTNSVGSSVLPGARWGQPDGTAADRAIDPKVCGHLAYRAENLPAASSPVEPKNFMGGKLLGEFENALLTRDAVVGAHQTAFNEMQVKLQTLAATFVPALDTGIDGASGLDGQLFDDAVNTYASTLETELLAAMAATGNSNPMQKMVTAMKADGWIMAGSWFMRAVFIQDTLTRAAAAVPLVKGPSLQTLTPELAAAVTQTMHAGESWLFASRPQDAYAVTAESGAGEMGAFAASGVREFNSQFKWMKNHFAFLRVQLNQLQSGMDNRHPIMALKDFGDAMLKRASSGVINAPMQSTRTASGQKSNNLMNQVNGTFLTLAMTVGTLFAVYIPLLPFVLFITAGIGWIILVAESIVAAPLWAAMKLAPEGDDMMGASAGGYRMILGVVLKPALMVLGMCAALLAIEPILRFFNSIFFASAAVSLGSDAGLLMVCATMGVYFGLLQQIITKVFSMIHEIPEKIPQWMALGSGSGSTASFVAEAQGAAQQGSAQAASSGAGGSVASIQRDQAMSNVMEREEAIEKQFMEDHPGLTKEKLYEGVGGSSDGDVRRDANGVVDSDYQAQRQAAGDYGSGGSSAGGAGNKYYNELMNRFDAEIGGSADKAAEAEAAGFAKAQKEIDQANVMRNYHEEENTRLKARLDDLLCRAGSDAFDPAALAASNINEQAKAYLTSERTLGELSIKNVGGEAHLFLRRPSDNPDIEPFEMHIPLASTPGTFATWTVSSGAGAVAASAATVHAVASPSVEERPLDAPEQALSVERGADGGVKAVYVDGESQVLTDDLLRRADSA